jgi:hypothetical protein
MFFRSVSRERYAWRPVPGLARRMAQMAARAIAAASLITVFHAAAPSLARSQEFPARDTVLVPQLPTRADTLPIPDGPPRSPRGAFFRSVVIPGWGQAWVGAPGRGVAYFALESGSLWMLHKSLSQLQQAKRDDAWLRDIGQLGEDASSPLVQSRRRQVEDWTAISIFLAFFAGADAFVSAYLADFDERVGVAPGADGTLRIEATLPVGKRP